MAGGGGGAQQSGAGEPAPSLPLFEALMAAAAGDLPPAALALQLAPAEAAEAERRETRAALAEATAAALMSSPTHRTMVRTADDLSPFVSQPLPSHL